MKRRGFIAGLFLTPIALRFAGALSPKAIAPVVESEPVLVAATESFGVVTVGGCGLQVGDLISIGKATLFVEPEVFKVTAIHLGPTPEDARLTVEWGGNGKEGRQKA